MGMLKRYHKEVGPGFGVSATEFLQDASKEGLGVKRTAHMVYDFTADGGGIAQITPKKTAVIPANALIMGGMANVIAAVTSLGSATVAIGLTAGGTAACLLAATAKAALGIGVLVDLVPVNTAATAIKTTAAGSLAITVAAAALTAGKIEVWVDYYAAQS